MPLRTNRTQGMDSGISRDDAMGIGRRVVKQRRRIWTRTCTGLLLGAALAFGGCDGDSSPKVYENQPIAPSYANFTISELKAHMGATLVDKGVNFVVYSENAERIEVLLFDDPESSSPTMRLPLVRQPGTSLWTLFVSGLGIGQHYGYVAWGPNWKYDPAFQPGSSIGYISDCDEQGNRFNPNKLLIDPYTRRIHRDFDWNKGNPASGTARDVSTWGAAAKSVVIKSDYKWSDNETTWIENRQNGKGHDVNEAIFYEVHPKGFTAKALDVKAQGTYRGIGEKAAYLKDLGITAVELMPIAEKPDDGTYWGYNTIAFFAPEQKFAQPSSKLNSVVDEFKWMVDELHKHDIEVILDVVYNHTGEGGFWRSKVEAPFDYGSQSNFDDKTAATIYSFRGLDNRAYYHLTELDEKPNHGYLDQTGVGNQMRTNHEPFRQLILDNLKYWVEEMHVDGFRFDLASILGVTDENPYNTDPAFWRDNVGKTVVQDIIDDPVFQKNNTRFIAEPWDIGHYAIGMFPKSQSKEGYAWSEWNGRFRDMLRRFVNRDDVVLNQQDTIPPYWNPDLSIGNILLGSSVLFGDDGRSPYNSVNFITAHDGFTLNDLVTYDVKHNKCSKVNPICCDRPYDAFCDKNSGDDHNESRNWCNTNKDVKCNGEKLPSCDETDTWNVDAGVCKDSGNEALKRQMIRNFFALLLFSQGSPMILGGDEYMRTQYGNNNAYSDSANNEYNWFRWGDWLSNDNAVRMHDFVRSAIKIRKQYLEFLAPKAYYKADNSDNSSVKFDWWAPDGSSTDGMWGGKSIGMYYKSEETGKELFIAINMETNDEKAFTHLPAGDKNWKKLLDTQSYFDTKGYFDENSSADKKKSQNIFGDGNGEELPDGGYTLKPRTIVVLAR